MAVRERISHTIAFRRAAVTARRELADTMVRVTLSGPELAEFASAGPNDHVKTFFPDPATGVLTAPSLGEKGVDRPTDGVVINRDYTPLAFRPATAGGAAELDIDFVLHGDDGPASVWAASAAEGDELVLAGPRGSARAPEVARAVLIADETALPALSRWVRMLPETTKITAIVQTDDEGLEHYLDEVASPRLDVEWLYRFDGPDQLAESVRSLGDLGDDCYVWGAGEATALIPVRRHLKRELGLTRDQVQIEGYWKRGVTNLDHHAPLDPSDPD